MSKRPSFWRQFFILITAASLIVITANAAQAADKVKSTSNGYQTPSYHRSSHKMAVSGGLGFYNAGSATYQGKANNTDQLVSPKVSGLFGFGGDFDYYLDNDVSIGALFRYYNTSDTGNVAGTSTEYTNSLLTIGATIKAYIAETENWAPYLQSGFGILSPGYKEKTNGVNTDVDMSMGFGFYFGIGVLYKINHTMAFGFENLRAIGVGEKINGMPLNDYMLKFRYALGN